MSEKRTIFTSEINFNIIIESCIKLRDFIINLLDVIGETNNDENFTEDGIIIKSFFQSKFTEIIDYITLKKDEYNQFKSDEFVIVNFDFIINRLSEIMDVYEAMMSEFKNKYGSQLQSIENSLNVIFFNLNDYIMQLCAKQNLFIKCLTHKTQELWHLKIQNFGG